MPDFDTDDDRWNAILTHDSQADGAFWYGVKTTGIYCRPACPSRRPRPENVHYFGTPAEAEQAGFRPCKRCTPDQLGRITQAVLEVKRRLDAGEVSTTLTTFAAAVGVSPFHLQRAFKAQFGISPKQYAMQRRTTLLKQELRQAPTVSRAIYEAGHEAAATAYARSTDQLGMKPGEYRRAGAGQHIRFCVTESPLGDLLVAATDRGLCSVRLGERKELRADLEREYPKAALSEAPDSLQTEVQAIQDYLAGQPLPSLPTDAPGTEFQKRVWAVLSEIPTGETRTYAEIAELLGQPNAVRAVARACATNPVALVVPCHRVVRKGGALSGYRWGAERKQALLDLERLKTEQGAE